MTTSFARFRHYGFETAQGNVEPHYILSYQYQWMSRPIEQIVVKTFSKEAEMNIEIAFHWTQFTKWFKKQWPSGGEIVAVVLKDGKRIRATAMHVGHDSASYEAAPLLCRDVFKIVLLDKSTTLMEVEGVMKYARSKRDDVARQAFLDLHATNDLPNSGELQ